MTHLTPNQLVDAIDGAWSSDLRSHLEACVECRQQLEALSAVLSEAKQVEVPEPSPLYWQQLSRRVNETIDAEGAVRWPAWLRWQVLVPLGATAMIILALIMAMPRHDRLPNAEIAVAAEPVLAETDEWLLLADLMGDFDLDMASAAGIIEPGVAEQAVLELTADERLELTRLLEAELARAKS